MPYACPRPPCLSRCRWLPGGIFTIVLSLEVPALRISLIAVIAIDQIVLSSLPFLKRLVTRSSKAVVILASPKTVAHSMKRRLVVMRLVRL